MNEQNQVKIHPKDLKDFNTNGYFIAKGKAVADFRDYFRTVLCDTSHQLIKKLVDNSRIPEDLERKSFDELMDWCIHFEHDNMITRRFYEVWPSMPAVISVLNHPFIQGVVKQLGISEPTAGTVPLVRIDRPQENFYLTPAHQDYWYSMLSDNAVVIWLPVVALRPDMGYLQVIPGSHKRGLVTFKNNELSNEPYTMGEAILDSDFVEVPINTDEILIFNQFLLHRSGINRSDSARVSLQLRFNDLETLKELTSSFTATSSKFVKMQQNNILNNVAGR